MCITNTNIIQPRILHKPELTQTLSKTNLKKIVSRSAQSNTYNSYQLPDVVAGVPPCQLGKKNAPPLRG